MLKHSLFLMPTIAFELRFYQADCRTQYTCHIRYHFFFLLSLTYLMKRVYF